MSSPTKVLLINMPFGPIATPSLGLSLLQAGLKREGIGSRICYFNLRFANLIGEEAYSQVANESVTSDLLGEWIFSNTLYEKKTPEQTASYLNDVLLRDSADQGLEDDLLKPLREASIELLDEVVPATDDFMNQCLNEVMSFEPVIIGFSSVFQQQVAALSLAKRIKASLPDVNIIFGGSNCEGVMGMELLKQFAFVDIVVSGEGDLVFPNIVRGLLNGERVISSNGIYTRSSTLLPSLGQQPANTEMILDLDSLPLPDYGNYFEELECGDLKDDLKPALLFETSRGCWWGAKHHCTFCGLNGRSMRYRSKSATKAIEEISTLTSRHPGLKINMVDNILDMAYFKNFLPLLSKSQIGVKLAYEIKANLTRAQLKMLSDAGIDEIQPGIESLSDTVLSIMRKGVRGLQNIQFLKWCSELGLRPVWNLIFGFPGEPEEDYAEMADLIPLLTHLTPPYGTGRIRTDRFSPNFDRAEELGFRNLRPQVAYKHVYALSDDALSNIATIFAYDYAVPRDVARYARPVVTQVMNWKSAYPTSRLVSAAKPSALFIFDTRPIAKQALWQLQGLDRKCYEACGEARSLASIHRIVNSRSRSKYPMPTLRERLDYLCDSKLMVKKGDIYLALAVTAPLSRCIESYPNSGGVYANVFEETETS